jgi:hypothetical protein
VFAFTKYSNEPKALAHDIKYCTMQRNVINEAKKQHYSRLQQNIITKEKQGTLQRKREGKYIQWNRFQLHCEW